jgi:hypothetical protein
MIKPRLPRIRPEFSGIYLTSLGRFSRTASYGIGL